MKMHNFEIGDKVYYEWLDSNDFEVVGIRNTQVEIEGDFSGGTHNVKQRSWINYTEIKPTDKVIKENNRLEISSQIHELAYQNMPKEIADDLTNLLVGYAKAIREYYTN